MPNNDDFNFGDNDFFGDKQTLAQKNAEVSELLKTFKTRKLQEKKTFEENVDSEYWIAICFHSRAQKEQFLEKTGLLNLGDKYLDGVDVALELGVSLDPVSPPRQVKISKRWKTFT
jgi:hypothetical protein